MIFQNFRFAPADCQKTIENWLKKIFSAVQMLLMPFFGGMSGP